MTIYVGQVVQGAADAYGEVQMTTGLSPSLAQALQVNRVVFELASTLANTNGAQYDFCLNRKSLTAIPDITSNDLIAKESFGVKFVTSGMVVYDRIIEVVPQTPIFIIETSIYFAFDTNATSIVNTANIYVEATPVTITDAERIAILQSLID